MRVLHVIPAIASCYGGPSAALPQMCRALAPQGVETTIATTDADGMGRLNVPLEVATTYHDTPAIFFHRQVSESFKYSRPLASWLGRNVASFDVVHVHAVLSHACLAAGRACRTAGVPYIVRPLGTLDPWSLGQKALKKRLLLRAAGRSMLRHAAAIQYTSGEEKRLVESSLGLARGAVIPLGVDDGLFVRNAVSRQSNREETPPYVLALSRLHPVKGLEALIAAFARAVPTDIEWRLIVAGDGDAAYVDALKRLAAECGAGEHVVFPGWVEGCEKRVLLENASLFAVTSLHENFGVALVEALACGVPAIVSDRVHLAADIRDGEAGWVAGAAADSLCNALNSAMTFAEERARRGEAAARLAKRFAWSRVAGELVELYRNVLGVGTRHERVNEPTRPPDHETTRPPDHPPTSERVK